MGFGSAGSPTAPTAGARAVAARGRPSIQAWHVGAYGIAEAAHYLALPAATLRTWVRGRSYGTAEGLALRLFRLSRGEAGATRRRRIFVRARNRVLRFLRQHRAPFIAKIYPGGKVELWLAHETWQR